MLISEPLTRTEREKNGKKWQKKNKQQKQIWNYGWHERLFFFSATIKMAFYRCPYKYNEIHLLMWFDKHVFKSSSKKKTYQEKYPRIDIIYVKQHDYHEL